jgi:ribosomal-protein-alanine N-acetyltransferase
MAISATDRKSTSVRPLTQRDKKAISAFIKSAWRVHLRLYPDELTAQLDRFSGFLAEDAVGLRGFIIMDPLQAGIGLLVATGIRDTWNTTPFLDLLLPRIVQAARDHQLTTLIHIGNTPWLIDELKNRQFAPCDWLLAFERVDDTLPPPPKIASARLRTAHVSDLPELMELDNLAFEHIWHKSGSNISEALAQAASFTVAVVDNKIVAYQWCEMFDRHAHLTRLAVHPQYQGRGIGAQLLHQAITESLNMGADIITLNTQENNQRSQRLYQRFGFVSTRQRIPVLCRDLTSPPPG